ncbi:unnamed protein product [Rotaria sp. Silwood1]|nr:unnamed protein product [Rotaria sp. Silwood1]
MPLSSALQARLIERGILNATNINAALDASAENDEQSEEVFAESYDERDDHHSTLNIPKKTISNNFATTDVQIDFEDCIKCPNKWNPYHTCVEYCKKRYGTKHYTPDPAIEKRRRRMLKKYPLPNNWREVPDANLDRCYYWNIETDEVSWLPPSHPRSHITQSAIKLKQKEMERKTAEAQKQASGSSSKKKKKKKNSNDAGERSDTDEEDLNPVQKLKRKIAGKMLSYDVDPMDPSSYSDVPRGNWSSGLDLKGKAKTGVDDTASGELFQMRPYPSPGDVLRMNADVGTKKKSKNT